MFQGGALIRQARRDLEANGFDLTTGLLLPDGVTSSPQSSSLLTGMDPKPSRISAPQLQQPSPQPLQSVLPQQQNHLTSQQQHRQQPEEGLAGEIDRELAAIMDKSHLVVCLHLHCTVNVMGSSVLQFSSFYHHNFVQKN
jgi:hypothetical protein